MCKALFLRLSLAEKRKGTQCADAGSPISLNIRDPISDISKKSEIGVMNHEKMAGRTLANVKKKVGQCLKKTRPPALEKNQATWP